MSIYNPCKCRVCIRYHYQPLMARACSIYGPPCTNIASRKSTHFIIHRHRRAISLINAWLTVVTCDVVCCLSRKHHMDIILYARAIIKRAKRISISGNLSMIDMLHGGNQHLYCWLYVTTSRHCKRHYKDI